jgi:crossover junction endodeoxyribonuclease RuvC
MTRILGIDPGSRVTGYAVIEVDNPQVYYIASGCLHVQDKTLGERLKAIFEGITQVIEQLQPQELAVEQVFMHRNADSALKLGQARGVAICAGVMKSLPVAEYSPRQVKQAVVGRGHADKMQVQHMVSALLNLTDRLEPDAADALAVALCHGHTRQTLLYISEVSKRRRGRLR